MPSDDRVLNAILKFKGSWKNEIDRINDDNRRSFQNFHCGSRLLQVLYSSDDCLVGGLESSLSVIFSVVKNDDP